MSYYGVYVPPKFDVSVTAANEADKKPLVFTTKEEAFKVLKTHSDGRVKGFANRDEATHFAQYGQDLLNATNQSFNDSSKLLKSPSSALNPEKAAFRGPKIQELVEFRKAIESGNLTVVHAKVMENPRYLIGSGDTPAILKEGTRYNAMHVAALSKNPKMCELILSTIKPSYVQLFHGGRQTREVSEEIAAKLLDLYLNMPEKGRYETPLHLAVKYGSADVVEVLTSYAQCKMVPNSEMKLPKDLICFRAPSMPQEVKDRIARLLDDRFYVPVLRSNDSTVPSIVGEPFCARGLPNLSANNNSGSCLSSVAAMKSPALTPELQIRAFAGPMDQEQAESFRKRWRTPPAPAPFNRSSHSLNGSSLLLSAGNLSTENGLLLRSPVRTGNHKTVQRLLPLSPSARGDVLVSTPKGKSTLRSIDEFILDTETKEQHFKGSNESLNSLRVPGLAAGFPARKALFGNGSPCGSPRRTMAMAMAMKQNADPEDENELDASFRERHLKLTDNEKGLEVVGRLLAREQNVGWSEYWNFLDNFTNLSTTQGLQQLEQHLKTRAEQARERVREGGNENRGTEKRNCLSSGVGGGKEEKLNISDICDRLNELHLNNSLKLQLKGDQNNNNNNNNDSNQDEVPSTLNAFLCVEKSCQVYARRAMKIIVNNGEAAGLLNGTLTAELARLESLVCSYRDDPRFRRIRFQVAHSRFAHLVLSYLLEDVRTYRALLPKLKRSLALILAANVRTTSGGLEKGWERGEEDQEKVDAQQQVKSTSGHLKCLARFLLAYAENEEEKIKQRLLAKLVSEEDCERVWAEEEEECECAWTVAKGQATMMMTGAPGANVKNPHVMRMRDKQKKKRINDLIKKTKEKNKKNIELWPGGAESNKHTNGTTLWEYRNKVGSGLNEEDDELVWADSLDSDHSFDSTDSDECFFYTPVESPSEFLTASDRSDEDESSEEEDERKGQRRRTKKKREGKREPQVDLESYRNYILGDEPTKTDVDVFNAICDVEVDEATHPATAKWQAAIRLHSMEEIQNFPSLSMIVRQSIPICKLDSSTSCASPLSASGGGGRRLFSSPMKFPMSR